MTDDEKKKEQWVLRVKYSPSQKRDPKGSPTGGQWASGGGSGSMTPADWGASRIGTEAPSGGQWAPGKGTVRSSMSGLASAVDRTAKLWAKAGLGDEEDRDESESLWSELNKALFDVQVHLSKPGGTDATAKPKFKRLLDAADRTAKLWAKAGLGDEEDRGESEQAWIALNRAIVDAQITLAGPKTKPKRKQQ